MKGVLYRKIVMKGLRSGLDHIKLLGQYELLPSLYLILFLPDLGSSFRPAVLFSLYLWLLVFLLSCIEIQAFLIARLVKNPPAMQETLV